MCLIANYMEIKTELIVNYSKDLFKQSCQSQQYQDRLKEMKISTVIGQKANTGHIRKMVKLKMTPS